jgi:SAM-dependent methyltransferase
MDRPRGIARVRTLWRLAQREPTDPEPFYRLLAEEAADDLERRHGPLAGQTVVDLGCGPGFYTDAFRARGADVIPVDKDRAEMEARGAMPAGALLADAGDLPLPDGSADGAFCSNLLEHTPDQAAVLAEIERVLRPGGWAYISWTNWYSPWGGHEMWPYHYLGPRLGPKLYERRHGRPGKNVYGHGLWPVHVGPTVRLARALPRLRVVSVEPRYWPRLRFLVRIPLLREVVTWNCLIRAEKL